MRISLHTKFLFSLITLVIISLATMGLVLLRDADQRLEEFKFLQAKSQARTLGESCVEPLLVKDYSLIENLVNVAINEENYAYAAIVSPQGMVISHSNLDLVGHRISTAAKGDRVLVRQAVLQQQKINEIVYPIVFDGKHLANAHIAYTVDTESLLARDSVKLLIEILVLTLIVMSLGSILITKRLTQPIVRLTRAVNNRQKDSRLVIDRDIVSQNDEVGALSNAFQSMSDQLVDRLEELQIQIKERDNARAANETKSAFLANVSHELRTPLNAIIGYSELLLEVAEDKDDEESKADLVKIHSSARHLTNLINDMLDLSKIEAGKMVIIPQSIDINEFLQEITTTIKPLVDKNNNKLVCDPCTHSENIYADPLRLKQVVINLLSNAAKFTSNGEIHIAVENAGDDFRLSVIDTGIGLTEEQLEKVFDAFTQADKKTSIKYGGTGLGLTISRRLCQMMGGDLTAISQFGKGSTFTITMPKVRDIHQTSACA